MKSISALRAAVQKLKAKGMNVELKENAIPRMYFNNQLRDQVAQSAERSAKYSFNEDPNRCDYIIEVKDAYYDVALVRLKEGGYAPLYDNYTSGSNQSGSNHKNKMLSSVLGRSFENTEKLTGEDLTQAQKASEISHLLQGYVREATMEQAIADGLMLESEEEKANGELVMVFADHS